EHIGSELPSSPIEILKQFDPKPLLPERKNYTWKEAIEAPPETVYALSIGEGQFDVFPDALLSFKNLESLWIGARTSSSFTHFPDAFFYLKELHTIQIYGSAISAIDRRVGALKKLEELTIESSELTQVPDSIGQLTLLTNLSFRYNRLKYFPDIIDQLPNLRELNVESNRFVALPASLAKVPILKIDRKHRKLFMDTSYQSHNPNPIDEGLFDLSRYPKEQADLADRIDAIPELLAYKNLILEHTLMATYLVMNESDASIPIGRSKLGGGPDLPVSWVHPATKKGLLYVFHAQINCAEIAAFQNYLPRRGILYFFVNDEEYAEKPKVLYYDGDEPLSRRTYTPQTAFADSNFDGNPRRAVAIQFEHAISLPELYNSYNHGAERYPQYAHLWEEDPSDEGYERVDAFEEKLMELRERIDFPVGWDNGRTKFPTHSMNSSVFTQHESPQEQAAARFGGEPHEWMVLLCLESVGEFSFWDAGTLSYCVHKKDLALADFTRIHTSIESS
ncbi:MAG: DUF1963 domain-containing protein, partial [Bacteroidota bacterium]